MNTLFCMYCNPQTSGEHQKSCRLYKDVDDPVLAKFEDTIKKAGIDVSEIMDKARKARTMYKPS